MNWYKKAQSNQNVMNDPSFKGFHCQKYENYDNDKILKDYAESYFNEIVEYIPYDLHDKMAEIGIDRYPPDDYYSEEFEKWSDKVEEFLYDNGIRWIFVSHDKIFNNMRSKGASYGDYCYYILIPDEIILYDFVDVHEENASGIVYDSRKGRPTRIPIGENNELV